MVDANPVPFIDLEAEVESDDGDEDLQKAIVRSLAPQGKGKAPSAVEAGGMPSHQ